MIPMKNSSSTFCSCHENRRYPLGEKEVSRRNFISKGMACTVAFAASTIITPKPALAQSALSPDAALQALLDGNTRFVQKQLASCIEDLTILKQNTVYKQEPFASVLSCADSRVPVELVFDQSIGDYALLDIRF